MSAGATPNDHSGTLLYKKKKEKTKQKQSLAACLGLTLGRHDFLLLATISAKSLQLFHSPVLQRTPPCPDRLGARARAPKNFSPVSSEIGI